ncbi:Ester hydrolase-like protein [Dinothrombium tinctorium]|uniref:Ester hydrolase-like protein n=1 Tax=Dinothrombium tinctorium TaxID=1965070 RepID=A0A443RC76_9ACAR|nr:Ester hydrolase-like protein [Dinothrombium tinctorium]
MSLLTKYPSIKRQLLVPSLQEIADLLNQNLNRYFAECNAAVVDCPNLRQAPFHLANEGLCGNPMVADIGGVRYLSPLPRLDKQPYNFTELGELMGFKNALVIGAACAPFHVTGVNCELIPNLAFKKDENECLTIANETHAAKIDERGECELFKLDSVECCLLGNVFVCEGKPGKVLKINAKKRIGNENFTESIRNIIREKYGENIISLGGVFLIKQGTAKLHIMPDFSTTPLNTEEQVNEWLKFFSMKAPLICLSVFHSYDDNLELRMEHTHCFSTHGAGGHYHYDITPDEIEYEAYFNVAETLYRVDAPKSG